MRHKPSALAFVHAGLDERDEAFALLAPALGVHDHWAVFALTHFPVLDDLRPDPRSRPSAATSA